MIAKVLLEELGRKYFSHLLPRYGQLCVLAMLGIDPDSLPYFHGCDSCTSA